MVAFGEESGIKPTATDGCPATAGLGGQEITSDPPFYDSQLSSNARAEAEAEEKRRSGGLARGGFCTPSPWARLWVEMPPQQWGEKKKRLNSGGRWRSEGRGKKKKKQKATEAINHGAICEEMRPK